MIEKDLQAFIKETASYFEHMTDEKPVVGLPFVKGDKSVALEFTGIIGISGKHRGGIYITASKGLVEALARIVGGSPDVSTEELGDMAGELANTIAGNVQRVFGSDFLISVPTIVTGQPRNIKMKLRPPEYVIPFEWRGHNAYLVVGIE